jgi:hypothetical protein
MFHFLLAIFISLTVFLSFSKDVYALKKFVPKSTGTKTVTRGSIAAKVAYRPDKRGVLLTLSNFANLNSVDYILSYDSAGLQQGVGGKITSDNNPLQTRELLFGTCSGGVCKYHQNMQNARLNLTASLKNGTLVRKSYRIKTYF